MSVNGETRKQRKAATRGLLLRAAREQFLVAGIARTAVGDVSQAAGVAHGTFYVHFENKDAVVRELLAELNADLAERLAATFKRARSRPLRQVVRAVAGTFLSQWEQERELIACLAEHLVAGLSLAEARDGVNPPMAVMLETGLREFAKQRGAPLASVELLTHALLAMWLRIGLRHLFGDGVSRRQTLSMLVDLTVASIDATLPEKEDRDATV